MLTRVRSALAGRYALEVELGRGATAVVYRARDLKHGRRVALKVVEPDVVSTIGSHRFLQEIRTTARLNHPHILPLFDSGEADGFIFYTMPLVEGESLRERLDRGGRMPLETVLTLVTQIADAISYAHCAGIIHRDIKPENILIGGQDHVWVADFGLARALAHPTDHRLTSTGIAVGSPQYMSPEQAAGESDIDGRSDVYSLACIVFEALCGDSPFTATSVSSMLARHLAEPAPSIQDRCPEVPSTVDAAIRRAMSKDKSHRFRDAHDFVAALQEPPAAVTDQAAASAPPHVNDVHRQATTSQSGITRWFMTIADEIRGRGVHRAALAYAAAALVLVLLGVTVVLTGIYTLPSMRRPASGSQTIAMFPFRATNAEVRDWTEGVPDLLSSMLDGAAGLVMSDPWSLWRHLRTSSNDIAESPDPERAAELARRSGADRYVLGSIVSMGDSISVSARIYDTRSGRPLHTLTTVGATTNLRGIVRELAVQFLATTAAESRVPALGGIDAGLTKSPEALKAYMLARLFMRRGMLDSAEIAINGSLEHDTLFTAAIVQSAIIASMLQFVRGEPYSGLGDRIDRALTRDSLLNDRDRLRLTALRASIRTDGAAAAEALHGILAQDSTDLHAWTLLQYVSTVYGWQYGSTEETAVDIAERVLRVDSGNVPMLAARAWQAVALHDVGQFDRLIRLLAADSTSVLSRANLACLRALAADDTTFAALAVAEGSNRIEGITMLRCLRHARPERGTALTRVWRASDDPWLSARGVAEEVRLDIARGRTRRIGERLRAGEFAPPFAIQLGLMLAAASLAGVGDPVSGADAVAALELSIPVDSAAAYFETRPVWWAGWMIGAHHAQFGDTLLSRRWQAAMEDFPSDGSPAEYAAALRADIEARLAVRRGNTEAALQHARRAFGLWNIHTENQLESMPEPHMRLHLALLQRNAGHTDSAHALLRSLVPPTTWMGFLTARAAFELGAIEEEARNFRAAERYYTVAWNLWSGGADEVEPWRGQTAQALERMRRART